MFGQTNLIAARAIAEAQIDLQRLERYRAELVAKIPSPDEAALSARRGHNQACRDARKTIGYERRATSTPNKTLTKY
jgi:hypothetical protein